MKSKIILSLTFITTIFFSCGLPPQGPQASQTPSPTLEGLAKGPTSTPNPDDPTALQPHPPYRSIFLRKRPYQNSDLGYYYPFKIIQITPVAFTLPTLMAQEQLIYLEMIQFKNNS